MINTIEKSDLKKWYLPYARSLFFLSFLFILYGSIVPLEFKSVAFSHALSQFLLILQQPVSLYSKVDFATNVLIAIPLAFSLSAILYRHVNTIINVFVCFLVCLSISFFVEFLQLFTLSRVPSKLDVMAQFIGAGIGIALWLWLGQKISAWFTQWVDMREESQFFEKVFWIYLVILFLYNVLPLDLTINPVDIYHKWSDGRINLVLFRFHGDGLAQQIYQIIADIIIWIPITLFWILSHKKTPQNAFWSTIKVALLLEFFQLLVNSRFSDINDILSAALGAFGGILLARLFGANTLVSINSNDTTKIHWYLFLAVIFWSCTLIAIFWFPFDFNLQKEFVLPRLHFIYNMPFSGYFYTSEFYAITTLLQKIILLLPLGILLGLIKYYATQEHIFLVNIGAFFWSILLLIVIEFGQVLLPESSPDTSDIFLGLASILGGNYLLGYFLQHKNRSDSRLLSNHHMSIAKQQYDKKEVSPFLHRILKLGALIAFQLLILVLASNVISHIEQLPYNVRELVSSTTLWQHIVFNCALLLAVYCPLFIAYKVRLSFRWIWLSYPALFLTAIVLYFMLLFSIPIESIHDVIGFPVLNWSWHWESIGRFGFLYSAIFWVFLGAYFLLSGRGKANKRELLMWLTLSLFIVPLGHYTIVEMAATDNLTELMKDNGTWLSSLFIFLILLLFFSAIILFGQLASGVKAFKFRHVLFFSSAIFINYYWVTLASETFIFKYGKVFSALQFLLSPQRSHYIAQDKILLNFIIAYLIISVAIMLIQLPFWWLNKIKKPSPNNTTFE